MIDGASTDGTLDVLQKYLSQLTELVSEPDVGIYDALNKGIAKASGDVVSILHADDIYADNKVLERVAAAFTDPAVCAVYGDLQYVARADLRRVIRHWQAGAFRSARLRRGWMFPHPTLFLRRSLYERFGLFNTSYKISADYDLMLRILTKLSAGEVRYLPHVLVRMRMGGVSNRSLRTVLSKSLEDYRALRANGVGGLGTLALKNLSKLPQFIRR